MKQSTTKRSTAATTIRTPQSHADGHAERVAKQLRLDLLPYGFAAVELTPDGVQNKQTIGHDGGALMARVGKQAAGRLLDGREWNEFPSTEFTTKDAKSAKDSSLSGLRALRG